MKNNSLRRILAALLALLLCSFAVLPVFGVNDADEPADAAESTESTESAASDAPEAAAEDVISIATADDLLALAASCTLDSWSLGKTVVLEADLDLSDAAFRPIATFGGTLDGQGHAIRGLSVTDAMSPAGLIGTLQATGVVRDLTVEGTVAPGGDSVSTGGIVGENDGLIENCAFHGAVSGVWASGGIAGENKAAGTVRACRVSGTVDGENRTGGVVGCNLGTIEDCRNSAYVNIESVDPGIDLTDLNFDFSLDLSKLSELGTAHIATDTGGVAGYSSGVITGSANAATIGYPHIGYNVGGIAGRSCGQITDCTNTGSIHGRKDVGGIAGQVEPYLEAELDEKTTAKLRTQLNDLSSLVDKAANDAQGSAGGVSSQLNALSGYVDSAVDAANSVRVNVSGSGSVTGGGNVTGGGSVAGGANADSTTTGSLDTASGIGAASGSGVSIDVSHTSDSVSIDVGKGSASGVGAGSAADASVDHTGTITGGADANGAVTGSGGLDASGSLVAAPDLGDLTSAMNGVTSQLTLVNGALNGAVGTVANDVRAINKKCNEISETLFDAIDNARNSAGSFLTDTSNNDVDKVTRGKLSASRNEGPVSGDINTGGIAGSMAFEYTLDPEDDVSSDLSGEYQRQYTYRAIVQRCVNTGAVTGKRSYVGGIAGRMDLGLVTDCESYGALASEAGSYVGGITGLTSATVRSSYAKCSLSGKSYVGGITGSGVAETVDGGGSTVAGCISLVNITACEQHGGAISGADAGTFTGNRFLSDSLAGLDRASASGRAEPISYEELAETDGLPDTMTTFTLSFVADGEVLSAKRFAYGASFTEDTFPDIPEKDGYYAAWDCESLENLHGDTTVTAVYTPYEPALASAETREDGRPVMLAEGSYSDGDTLTMTAEAQTPSVFHVSSGSPGNRIRAYFESWTSGKLPPMSANWEVVEQWSVQISSNSPAPYRVRYLPPEGSTSRLRVYVEQDGVWQTAEHEAIGSYLAFDLPQSSSRIAIVSTMPVWWVWAAAALLLALLIFLLVHFIRKAVRHARQRREATPQPATVQAAAGTESGTVAEPNVEPARTGTASDGEAEQLLARARTAEEKLAQLEQELAALRAAQSASAPDPSSPSKTASSASAPEDSRPKAEAAGTAAAPKRRFRWWIPVVVLAVLLAAGAVWFFGFSNAATELNAYRILRRYSDQELSAFDASLAFQTDDQRMDTDVSVMAAMLDGQRVFVLHTDGLTLYEAGSTLYLENGRAYTLGAGISDYGALLETAAELYQLTDAKTEKTNEETVYSITVSPENSKKLTEVLFPAASDYLPDSMEITLELHVVDEQPSVLCFRSALSGTGGTALDVTLTFRGGAVESPAIPEAVQTAMNDPENTEKIAISKDIFRLISAWDAFLAPDTCSADLTLSANCGPVVFDTTLAYDRLRTGGQRIERVQKGALSVYISEDKLCDSSGNSVEIGTNSFADSAKLPELACTAVLSGTPDCTSAGSTYTYTLSLDADGMAAIAEAIAPDAASLDLTYRSGSLTVTVQDDALARVTLTCTGSARIILSDTEFTLSAEILPASRAVEFPAPVLRALKNE